MYANIKSAGTSNNKNEYVLTSDTNAVDVKVERESCDEVQQIEIEVYTDCVIKVEMTEGHEVLQHAVYNSNCSQEMHSESSAKTPEPNQNQNSSDRNGTVIKLEPKAMSTFKEEQTEDQHAEHEIKYEIVIEPVALPAVTYTMEENDEPLPKKRRLHENDKSAKNAFQCNVCAKKYVNKPDLVQHIESHDEAKRNVYLKCEECTYQSVTQSSLERHLKLHDKNRPFVCVVCGYRYMFNKQLQQHLRNVHSDEKTHECGYCDYKTNIIRNLHTHLRIHSGEKPYSCPQCDYKCNHKSHLKIHSLIHTGEKPYSCSQCDFKCNHKNSLQRHLLIHTGEKPYSCSECDYKCTRSSNLKRHLRMHNYKTLIVKCTAMDAYAQTLNRALADIIDWLKRNNLNINVKD